VSLDDIDAGQLYRDHMARAGRRAKTPDEWNARAQSMGRRIFSGTYVEDLVARLDLTGCETLLDVGCGPGTIALTVAPRLAHVYGLDFSLGMIEAFGQNARARGVTNATGILRAWEDPWDDVPVCDVAIASRSTQVADLEPALLKLHAHARRRVYLTHKVGGRFLDESVYEALGRDDEPLPDYIYVLNILHRHGVHPRLDYLDGENRLATCADFEDCVRKVEWSLGTLTAVERDRLRAYYDARGGRVGGEPMRWALIWWEKAWDRRADGALTPRGPRA
jgi:SAM-dependent methyltransferase